jgi:hypothetical protein
MTTRREKKLTEAHDELVRQLLLERFGTSPKPTPKPEPEPEPEVSAKVIAERRQVLTGIDVPVRRSPKEAA